MSDFYYFNPTKVYFGVNKLEELANIELPGKKAIVITTNDETKQLYADRVQVLLKKNGVESIVFDGVHPNPSYHGVNAAAKMAKEAGCDFVVALGGGSSIDTAKGTAVLLKTGDENIGEYIGVGMREGATKGVTEHAPIVAIPTTGGTGSDVGPWAIIGIDEENLKLDVSGEMYPTISIIDPALHTTVPAALTAAQGMDVIFHAAEGFLNNILGSPVTNTFALKSLGLASRHLAEAYRNGTNVEAREGMALACYFSGYVLANCPGISLHQLSASFAVFHHSIPHGVALCLTSIEYFEFFEQYCPEQFKEISKAVGYGDDPHGVVRWLEDIQKAVGLYHIDYAQYGITPDWVDKYAEDCVITQADVNIFDPHPMSVEDCKAIILKGLKRCAG